LIKSIIQSSDGRSNQLFYLLLIPIAVACAAQSRNSLCRTGLR